MFSAPGIQLSENIPGKKRLAVANNWSAKTTKNGELS
jgi:hypothetical protein